MPELLNLLNALHAFLTAGFVLVTFALLGVSLFNRFRVRHCVMRWRGGSWRSVPLGPITFVMLVGLIEAFALSSGTSLPPLLLGGYLLGSVAWFLASYLSTTVMVCECGIVADVHRRDRAVSWGQISDYFEFSRGLSRGFVILYRDGQNGQKRMELEVPLRQHAEFRRLIDLQLHRRSEPVDQHARGKTALEG